MNDSKKKKPTARQIAVHLNNLYYNTGYGIFACFHRDAAIKEAIDELYQIYGSVEEDTDKLTRPVFPPNESLREGDQPKKK